MCYKAGSNGSAFCFGTPYIVCRESYQIVYTTTIMDTNQKAEIINTTLSMSKYNYSEADLIMALIKTILLIGSTTI